MDWTTRLNLAIDYVEENLGREISIENVASVACCSKYHFHRVFHAKFNVTLAEYIRRRRLTSAAVDLVNSKVKIIDIALKYGYESPNAFTRSFRKIHGVNPSEVRSSQVKLATYHRVTCSVESYGGEKMDYKIVEKPAFEMVGKSKKFEFDEFAKEGQKFWKEYVGTADYNALCELSKGKPGCVTGASLLTAYFPIEQNELNQFLDALGVEATSNNHPKQFETHVVPSATYAEFECSYRSAMKTNRYIYGQWFSATGYERDGDKPDIVSYFPMPFQHFSKMNLRWWIPIVRK